MLLRFLWFLLLFMLLLVPAFSQWQQRINKNGIRVSTREVPGSDTQAFKVDAVFKSPVKACEEQVNRIYQRCFSWMPNCKLRKRIKRFNESRAAYYSQFSMPWPFQDRDLALTLQRVSMKNSVVYQVRSYTGFQGNPDHYRMKKIKGQWLIQQAQPGHCRVTYTMHMEPGGNVPAWVINRIITEQPYNMFRAFQKKLGKPD